MARKTAGVWPAALVCLAAFVSTTCSSTSSSNPTAPTPTPTPAPTPTPTPTPTPPPAPSPRASVEAAVNPNPVPWSGQPITDAAGCANIPNTWFYDQVLQERGGAAVMLTSRQDKFDDRVVNNLTGLNITVGANGSTTIKTRWCSSNAGAHAAQSIFSGTDSAGNPITVTAPVATLKAK